MEIGANEFNKEKVDRFIKYLDETNKVPQVPTYCYVSLEKYNEILKEAEAQGIDIDADILNIVSSVGHYKLKRNETINLEIWALVRGGCYMINPNRLNYTVPKEHKEIVSITKDGKITVVGKRKEVCCIKISLKSHPKCYCVIYVEVV